MKLNLSCIGIILLHVFAISTTAECASQHYCPYFKNRAPSPQINLENCTWFRENSCCLNHELNEIFSAITTPLKASSPACWKYTNYLMCYVCAPNQDIFYEDEKLTVCEEFCDRWYSSCKDGLWKGFVVRNLYKSGAEFCRARKFIVAEKNDLHKGCYTFKLKENLASFVSTNEQIWMIIVLVASFVAVWSV